MKKKKKYKNLRSDFFLFLFFFNILAAAKSFVGCEVFGFFFFRKDLDKCYCIYFATYFSLLF